MAIERDNLQYHTVCSVTWLAQNKLKLLQGIKIDEIAQTEIVAYIVQGYSVQALRFTFVQFGRFLIHFNSLSLF